MDEATEVCQRVGSGGTVCVVRAETTGASAHFEGDLDILQGANSAHGSIVQVVSSNHRPTGSRRLLRTECARSSMLLTACDPAGRRQ
jgi:hypothetical protein